MKPATTPRGRQPTRLSEAQRHDMMHALGLTRSKTSYRNYYAADPSGPAANSWRDLVGMGLAIEQPAFAGPLVIFRVTDLGRAALTQGGNDGKA